MIEIVMVVCSMLAGVESCDTNKMIQQTQYLKTRMDTCKDLRKQYEDYLGLYGAYIKEFRCDDVYLPRN